MAGNTFPINLHQTLLWKVRNFPDEVYNFDPGDNLTTLMGVLLGNAGTGQLAALQVAARLSQQNLEFSDLDNIIGQLLSTPRLVSELYATTANPFTDQISISDWRDVIAKDSSYRERLIGIAAALLKGASVLGLQSIAEAAGQVKFRVLETWNTAAAVSGSITIASGITSGGFGVNEVILVPSVPPGVSFTQDSRNAVSSSIKQLKPTGTIVTIASGTTNYVSVPYVTVSGSSEYFSFSRSVIAAGISQPSLVTTSPDQSIAGRYWLRNGKSVLAPEFAHLQTQEISIDQTGNILSANTYALTNVGRQTPTSTTEPIGVPSLRVSSTVYGAQ